MLVFPFLLPGQKTYPTGLIMDDEEYEQLSFSSKNIQIDYGQRSISRSIDLAPYCPEVRHQGDLPSCVGWSAGYAAMTIERALRKGWTDPRQISQNANSALFVFNQVSQGNCELGISMPKALALLQEKGNCLAREFDFDVNDCLKEATEAHLQAAEEYRIDDFLPLFQKDAGPEEKIRNVKRVLAQNKPVIIGMTILSNFYTIEAGESRWFPGIGDTNYAGSHAMVVVGYDDDRFYKPNWEAPENELGAFKLMNSWGKNWGDKGFIWISYADFAEHCRHAYAILLADGPPIDFELDTTPEEKTEAEVSVSEPENVALATMEGSFGFRQFTGEWYQNNPVFKEANVRLIDDHYVLSEPHRVGDAFQLYVKSGFDNGYIYVFSVDANGKAEMHFPMSEEYDIRFQGQHESALLMSGGSLLTIPAIDEALQLSYPGEDHLVALFSTQKIKGRYFEYLLNALSQNKEHLKDQLFSILEPHMIPLPDITYHRNSMSFDVSSRSDGKIVPIVLTVEVDP